MCLTSVFRPNRSCADIYLPVILQPFEFTSPIENEDLVNCTSENVTHTTVVITEIDAINIVHSVQFNVSNTDYDVSTLDTTRYPFPNTIWNIRPIGELAALAAVLTPFIILGIITNAIILTIFARHRWLRTPSNYLIANMAATDMVILLTCPWMLLVHYAYQNYQLSSVGCRIEGFLQGFLLVTGVVNLTAISYDRLTAVVLPREAKLNHRGALFLVCATWVIGFLFALPLSIYRNYRERQWQNFFETYCSEDVTFLPVYWHVLLSTLVWFPLVVMIICYTAIFRKLDIYEKSLSRRWAAVGVRYRTRAAKTAAMVLAAFIICRMPFTALVFIRTKMRKELQINSVDGSFLVLWIMSNYIIYFNCAINPFIYGYTNERFRRAMEVTPVVRWFMFSWCCFFCNLKSDQAETSSEKPPQDEKNIFKNIHILPPKVWVFGAKEDGEEVYRVSGSVYDLKKYEEANFVALSSRMTPLTQEYI